MYSYSVDGDLFTADHSSTTGAAIKARLAEAKRAYALYEESTGSDPDRLINDADTIQFEQGKVLKFYTVPPASFGAS